MDYKVGDRLIRTDKSFAPWIYATIIDINENGGPITLKWENSYTPGTWNREGIQQQFVLRTPLSEALFL